MGEDLRTMTYGVTFGEPSGEGFVHQHRVSEKELVPNPEESFKLNYTNCLHTSS